MSNEGKRKEGRIGATGRRLLSGAKEDGSWMPLSISTCTHRICFIIIRSKQCSLLAQQIKHM